MFSKYCFTLVAVFCLVFSAIKGEFVDLAKYEMSYYSADGEDGVTKYLLEILGTTNKYFVEFGVGDATQCNTRFLREQFNWHGLMMDRGFKDTNINLQQEYVTAENINVLLEKYNTPQSFDVLSVDIDYNDFYVLHELLKKYRPRIIIAEYNSTHLPDQDKIVIYDPTKTWDGSNYFGASFRAFYNLGLRHGYTLVYAERAGVNLFLVCNEAIKSSNVEIKNVDDCNKIYMPPTYGTGPNGGHPIDKLNRPWTSSQIVLKTNA